MFIEKKYGRLGNRFSQAAVFFTYGRIKARSINYLRLVQFSAPFSLL